MRREKVDQRVTFVTTRSQLDEIDAWRIQKRPIPSRNAAIRELLDRALKVEREEGDDGQRS
jgi:hypothetical protein